MTFALVQRMNSADYLNDQIISNWIFYSLMAYSKMIMAYLSCSNCERDFFGGAFVFGDYQ